MAGFAVLATAQARERSANSSDERGRYKLSCWWLTQPWTGVQKIAVVPSEYFHLIDEELAAQLENKKHQEKRSADVIRGIAREKAALRRENKILRELHRYYEYQIPWLIDLKGEDLDDLIRQSVEPRFPERFVEIVCVIHSNGFER